MFSQRLCFFLRGRPNRGGGLPAPRKPPRIIVLGGRSAETDKIRARFLEKIPVRARYGSLGGRWTGTWGRGPGGRGPRAGGRGAAAKGAAARGAAARGRGLGDMSKDAKHVLLK